MNYSYCPECGAKTIQKEIGEEGLLPYCVECKKPFFDLFHQCVIVVVINEFNEVALLKQKKISEENLVLVAGYVKKGETAEEAAIREVKEETGQDAEKITYVRSYYHERKGLLMLGFIVRVRKQDFVRSKEVDNVDWYKAEESKSLLRHESIGKTHLLKSLEEIKKQNNTVANWEVGDIN